MDFCEQSMLQSIILKVTKFKLNDGKVITDLDIELDGIMLPRTLYQIISADYFRRDCLL